MPKTKAAQPQLRVLFVCLGNICRSPTAEGVFRHMVAEEGLSDRIITDSAGTSSWHVGQPPDRRAVAHAARQGIDMSDLRGRQATAADFDAFDYVLAMDQENLADLADLCPPGREDRLSLLLDFAPDEHRRDVPDPYYGGSEGFATVFDLVQRASRGLLDEIKQRIGK